ncbi:MAG: hypothetical protein DRP01_06095 [Archaeoglobales archaeon]|nr:MAG: hypothetical protein DRP01_06095 [Archaeoglobales archaeon]
MSRHLYQFGDELTATIVVAFRFKDQKYAIAPGAKIIFEKYYKEFDCIDVCIVHCRTFKLRTRTREQVLLHYTMLIGCLHLFS